MEMHKYLMIVRTMKWTSGHIDVASTIVEIFWFVLWVLDCPMGDVKSTMYYMCKYYAILDSVKVLLVHHLFVLSAI
jgi:hypothetical protein